MSLKLTQINMHVFIIIVTNNAIVLLGSSRSFFSTFVLVETSWEETENQNELLEDRREQLTTSPQKQVQQHLFIVKEEYINFKA